MTVTEELPLPLPLPARLLALLDAECAAEAAASGTDEADLRQGVWLRWLERERVRAAGAAPPGPPPPAWLRAAVRAEARPARRRRLREVPYGSQEPAVRSAYGMPAALVRAVDGLGDAASAAEAPLLAAERRRALGAAVGRLPGRCPEVMGALLSRRDRTYSEIARELGMSQGSLGPVRSRCLGCLRRMLTAEVAVPELRGMVR